jgi:hypothetical protein
MKAPVYAIINDDAVKAVRTEDGGLEVLRYCPEKDEFERDMRFLEHIYFPTATKALDTDIVSKDEFEACVAKLRRTWQ